MDKFDSRVRAGHYAKKQLGSTCRLVSWVHHSRFEREREIYEQAGGGRVADLGCGDGTMLGMLMQSRTPPEFAVGLEFPDLVDDCRARYGDDPRLSFFKLSEAFFDENEHAFAPGNTPYTMGELWKSFVAGERQHIERPVLVEAGIAAHDHKGFNWRVLKRLLENHFQLERVTGTPVSWLPASLNSQVWFVGTAKP